MSRNRCDGLLARVDFPLYTLQTLTNRHVLVAGGGGASNTGVANGFEIFELSHNGSRFVAEEVMRHETGPNVVMTCSVRGIQNRTYLTAGQESHCQLYKVNIRMVDAAEMRRGSFRAENGLVRRRRRTVSENDNISKKDNNSNTTEKRISFEIRPCESVQTDFGLVSFTILMNLLLYVKKKVAHKYSEKYVCSESNKNLNRNCNS